MTAIYIFNFFIPIFAAISIALILEKASKPKRPKLRLIVNNKHIPQERESKIP